jgi:hypothetical protein
MCSSVSQVCRVSRQQDGLNLRSTICRVKFRPSYRYLVQFTFTLNPLLRLQ